MPNVVKSLAREMLLKVKQFCVAEQKNQGVLIPQNNVQKRVAAITGVREKCNKNDSDKYFEKNCHREKVRLRHREHLEKEYLRNDDIVDKEMDRIMIYTASDTETDFDSVSIHSSDSDVPMAAEHNYSIKL